MQLNYKILLIHNPFNRSDKVTYFSYAIRIGTNSHWNHIAIELDIDGEHYILESNAKGVIINKKEDWLISSNREVLERTPIEDKTISLEDVLLSLNEGYGYIDILYIALYILKRRGNPDYKWDGEVSWEGYFCSELAAYLEGRKNPYLVLPCDYEIFEDLITTNRYFTYKE